MKDYLKFFIQFLLRIFLHVFWIFPVKSNRIYFRAFHGKKYGCSPKYLFLHIQEKYKDQFECIWEMPSDDAQIQGAWCVKRLSLKSFIAMLTSRCIITNNDFMWWIPLRKSQMMLETWHGGGAYKRVGSYEHWSSVKLKDQKLNARQITHYISSSRKFTEVQGPSKWTPEEKFINTGMPRNEIFFYPEKVDALRKKVLDYYKLESDAKILLYAPTYRGLTGYKQNCISNVEPDYSCLLAAVKKRFGGNWVLFYRAHYFDSKLLKKLPGSIIDVTKYEDMQELLCAADALVTDYSSSIWDYALTSKPCFLFAPDLQDYIADRGFYTDPSTWPGSLAQNEDELESCILNFDYDVHAEKVKKHLADLGSYENKDSCAKVLKEIL